MRAGLRRLPGRGSRARGAPIATMSSVPFDLAQFRLECARNDAALGSGPLDAGRRLAAERTAIHDRAVAAWAEGLGAARPAAGPWAVVALGGTGRQEVCPCSDLDYALLFDGTLEGNPLLAEIQRQTLHTGEFERGHGFALEALPFNLDSVTSFDDPRQLNAFLDMRPVHDPAGLAPRFRVRIRESFDPFTHFLHLRSLWLSRWEQAADQAERLDCFDIKNDGLRLFLAAVWLLAGNDFRHSHEVYATLDPRVLDAYGMLLRVRQVIHLRRRQAGPRPGPLPNGRHAEDLLAFADFVSFGDMLAGDADERRRHEFSNEVRARLLAARRQVAVFAKGVIGGELRRGRRVAAGSPLVFGAGGLRCEAAPGRLTGRDMSRAALALVAAAQHYEVPIDPSELQGTLRDAGDWLEPVPELGDLLYESRGSLAASLAFLAQIPGAEERLFPGYGRFESSLDERVLTERKWLRGALANAKIRALERWVAEGRRRLDAAVSGSRAGDLAREGVSIPIEAAQLDSDQLTAVKLALKTKRLPLTADDLATRADAGLPLHRRFASGLSEIPLDDYYRPYEEQCRLPAELVRLTRFLVGERRAFKRLAEPGLSDARVVRELADRCGDEQRLRALFVFTCADRVEWENEQDDPARWFSIRELYYKAMMTFRPAAAAARPLLEAGFAADELAVLQGFGADLFGGGYGRHALRFASHLLRLASDPAFDEPKTALIRDGASVILGVACRDFRGLAVIITGSLRARGIGLRQAHLFTSRERGLVVDFFHLGDSPAVSDELPGLVAAAVRARAFAEPVAAAAPPAPPWQGACSLNEWAPGILCLRVEARGDEPDLVHHLARLVYQELGGSIHAIKAHSSRGRTFVSVYHSVPAGMPLEAARQLVGRWAAGEPA